MLEQAGMAGALAAGGVVAPAPRTAAEVTTEPAAETSHPARPCGADATAGDPYAGGPYPGEPYAVDQTAWVAPPPSRFDRFLHTIWTKPSWLAPLAVLGCVGAACTYVLQNNPTDTKIDPLGPCAFKALTGFDCPGCGGTRMVWYLLHGNVYEAARHHLVALIAVPVLIWTYIVWGVRRLTGYQLPTKRIPLGVILGYLIAWFVFAVLRNLPWAPFDWFYVS